VFEFRFGKLQNFWSAPNSAESSKVSGNFWSRDSGSSVAQTAPSREKTVRIANGYLTSTAVPCTHGQKYIAVLIYVSDENTPLKSTRYFG